MNNDINYGLLRLDLLKYYQYAYYTTNFSGALREVNRIEHASDDELLKIASLNNVNLSKYYSGENCIIQKVKKLINNHKNK